LGGYEWSHPDELSPDDHHVGEWNGQPDPRDAGDVANSNSTGTAGDDAEDDDRPHYVNIAAYLAGTQPEPPQPVLLRRTDGHALFYDGTVNTVYGDPESGKTWIVLAASAETLRDGRRVLLVDLDHNGVDLTVPHLLLLGVPPSTLASPELFRYYDDIDSALGMVRVMEDSRCWRPAVAVIDSIGELLPMMGANSNDPDEFTRAHTKVLKPLAAAGTVVIGVDHLPKNPNSRGLGPTGTGAKNRAVGGVSLRVVCRRQFVPGKGGTADLYVKKDRPGGLRQHCPPAREQEAGRFVLDPLDEHGTTGWRVLPPMGPDADAKLPTATAPYLAVIREQLAAGTFTARDVASASAEDETAVTRNDIDRAHYHIDALTKAALVVVVSTTRGGAANRWQLAEETVPTTETTTETLFSDDPE
jgi:hypothetical protein